jgi:hypothetical protein
MKKYFLITLFAVVAGTSQIFAQRSSDLERANEQFGTQRRIADPDAVTEDTQGTGEPIGEGIAILSVLGAAYAGFKAKRNSKR